MHIGLIKCFADFVREGFLMVQISTWKEVRIRQLVLLLTLVKYMSGFDDRETPEVVIMSLHCEE